MESEAKVSNGLHYPAPEPEVLAQIVERMKSEICETWLPPRLERWGPTKPDDDSAATSWTATITAKIGSATHYISCPGHMNSKPCLGYWCRRERQTKDIGLHCIYGGWVSFDGHTIIDVPQTTDVVDDDTAAAAGGRNLPHLRRLWAEHVLSQANSNTHQAAGPPVDTILSQDIIDKTYKELEKGSLGGTHAATGQEKHFGQGYGGWDGLGGKDGTTVLKRDSAVRNRRIGNYMDQCDTEPGGMWKRGDLEVWITWNGWFAFACRDSRWRPGYHLENLLCHLTTLVDYGPMRSLYRDRKADWLIATEWAWVTPPLDIPRRCAEVFRTDCLEMMRRAKGRAEDVLPGKYVSDDHSTREKRYKLYQDRAGEIIVFTTVGEGLDTPRGLVASWIMIVLNDILDYERDVLCGEYNNFVRSFTSDQQVVDAAAWILHALNWAVEHRDYDVIDTALGSAAIYVVFWRYNTPKMWRYEAKSVQDRIPNRPREVDDIADIVLPSTNTSESYGDLYKRCEANIRRLYKGCTCSTLPEGHNAWELLAQAFDEGGNDDVEELLHLATYQLNKGANEGDIRSECGLDQVLYESFVRFLDPDTGLVARLHYRSELPDLANTITE